MWAKLITIDLLFSLLWRIPPNTPTELLTRAIPLWFPPPQAAIPQVAGGSPRDGARSCCVAAPGAVHTLLLPRELPGTRPAAFIFFSATIYFIPTGILAGRGCAEPEIPFSLGTPQGIFLEALCWVRDPRGASLGFLCSTLPQNNRLSASGKSSLAALVAHRRDQRCVSHPLGVSENTAPLQGAPHSLGEMMGPGSHHTARPRPTTSRPGPHLISWPLSPVSC